ncbi:SNF2-related protein [Undibacterium sp. TJN19]|uniref:DEAD/DEAH box helicase n=1 Tax=Undibacterium sp. TJN19 TaxID=3413055 RepID=UPI003BF10FB8
MSSKNRHFSLDDLAKLFPHEIFIRGLNYATENKVRGWSFDNDFVESEVQGSGRNLYTQEIELIFDHGKLGSVNGACSCPVEYNCKHVAAVLLNILDHQNKAASKPDLMGKTDAALGFTEQKWLRELEFAHSDSATNFIEHSQTDEDVDEGFLIFSLSTTAGSKDLRLIPGKARHTSKAELKYTKLSLAVRDMMKSAHFLQGDDYELLALFNMCTMNSFYYSHYSPKGRLGAVLLERIAKAGKLYWLNTEKKQNQLLKLTYHDYQNAHLNWDEDKEYLRLRWQLDKENISAEESGKAVELSSSPFILPTDPPWLIGQDSCGKLHVPAAGKLSLHSLINLVQDAPVVALARTATRKAMADQLLELGLQNLIPLPAQLDMQLRADIKMQPVLELNSFTPAHTAEACIDFAVLKFLYDDVEAEPDDMGDSLLRRGVNGLEKILRDKVAEQLALEKIKAIGFYSDNADNAAVNGKMPGQQQFFLLRDQNAWLQFATKNVPELTAQGWQLRFQDDYRYNLQEVEDWYAEVAEENQQSVWFDLELGIVVNQTKISLLPLLVSLIRQAPQDFSLQMVNQRADDEQVLLSLPDHTRVALPYARIKPILLILGELYFNEHQGDKLRLPMLDAARLAELSATTHLRWIGGERQQSFGQRLAEFGGIKTINAPNGLRASLRDYQKEGVAWMQFLREYQLAGILADDMGLGKTIQTLTHILLEKEAGRLTQPALVIAPTSLMDNWASEAQRFTPDLKVLVLQGKERSKLFEQIPQADLVLSTYALLPRDEEALRQHRYHLLILDEAQYIKNAQAKASQTASLLQANHRLCLTGTPLQNHLGELWAQFNFLMPGLLGDSKAFTRDFQHPIEKLGDSQRHALLTRRIKPFLLRRTKDKVATELPAKTEIIRHIELTGAQRDLYETVRLAMDEKVREEIAKKGIARSQIIILDALLKLRQVCCDPRLVKITGAKASKGKAPPSAKLTELLEMVEELLSEGRKILIFSQFTSMLQLIATALQEQQISYAMLTGDTENRGEVVRRFQEGHIPVFLISLKAGGVGLNLTAADTVIHYDPWWNPAAENQATDRAWRIGQDKPVFVYRLIAKGTLEEKIQEMQIKKADLARAILDQGEVGTAQLTADDLQGIFAPLE